jgi:hypothetical protein
MTIYIFRHQEGGGMSSNCLSKTGIKHTYTMANKIKELEPCTVYTCIPSSNGKHIRPIQTASLVCSRLCKCVHLIDRSNYPSKYDACMNHIIIWHHGDMNKILNIYFPGQSFTWSDYNYSGCLIVNQKKWTFHPKYLTEKTKKNRLLLSWISKLSSCSCSIFK